GFELFLGGEQAGAAHLAQVERQRVAGLALHVRRQVAGRGLRGPIARAGLLIHGGAIRVGAGALGRRVSGPDAPLHGRYLGGRNRVGSTGLPCRRISKWSFTRSVSLAPISAIFCPLRTDWSSLTSSVWLC